jgi:ribonuclease BN (tRNA processing enzyme)
VDYQSSVDWRRRFIEWVHGASVLVHDTMFSADEYPQHRGWGHSTYEEAVDVGLEAEVERLLLFHHRPERTDDEVDRCVDHCRELVARRGGRLDVIAAAEGMSFDA